MFQVEIFCLVTSQPRRPRLEISTILYPTAWCRTFLKNL